MSLSKKLIMIISSIILSTTVLIYSDKDTQPKKTSMQSPQNKTAYSELWKTVDSLADKGLTRSVLTNVTSIDARAKKENNTSQRIKATIYRLRFESYIEEDAYVKAIDNVVKEIQSADFPLQPVLHSLLASIYWQYYTMNRWKFSDRTTISEYQPEDIRTWDLQRIVEHTVREYELSLAAAEKLQHVQLNAFDDILVAGDKSTRKLRPTLYDFLAHRAVDFFMSQEADLIKPANTFEIDDPRYLSSSSNFVTITIQSEDSLSLPLHALRILKTLLEFHKKDADPAAFIDADLKRLHFVREKAVFDTKDSLYLSTLLALEKRFSKHPSSAEIKYEIAQVYYQQGSTYQPLVSDTNKWMVKKAYDLCVKTIEKAQETTHGVECCKYLKSVIEQKSLECTFEKNSVPEKPSKFLLSYKNLSKLYARIVTVDPEIYYATINRKTQEQCLDYFLSCKKVTEWPITLENDGDFQLHRVECMIPPLKKGFYVVLVGNNPEFSYDSNAVAYTDVWVSNVSYIMRQHQPKGTEYYVLDRTTGKPVQHVTAQLFTQSYDHTKRVYTYNKDTDYNTDSTGYFLIPPSKKGESYYIRFSANDDVLHSDRAYNQRFYSEKIRPQLRTVFFTDRAIYRPGQPIYFKGILLEKTGNKTGIKPKLTTKVTLYDVNYQPVTHCTVTSNEYGTFNGSFTAPTGSLNGAMTIRDDHGSVQIQVEEYKRPTFEVTVNPVNGAYRLNDKIPITGHAKAYAGSTSGNAKVSYRVTRTAIFPWWYHRWYSFRPASPEMEITNGTTTTDDKGEYTISFTAIPDRTISKNLAPSFSYAISIDVTDIQGETQSTQKTITIGYAAINLAVIIPETIDKASKDPYPISITNSEGSCQKAHGTITVHQLNQPKQLFRPRLPNWPQADRHQIPQEEFYGNFPHDPYASEDEMQNWEKGKKVYDQPFNTNNDSLLHLEKMSKWSPGHYVLEAITKDSFGTTVKDIRYFTLFSRDEKTVPVHGYDWFTVDKTKAEPGESVTILVGSKSDNTSMLYEIECKDEIVHREWLHCGKEQKKLTLPIIEKYRGDITVRITFVKDNRNFTHDKRITVPYTNKELTISTETFRNKLLPGQKEEWKVSIKGSKGDKVAAELLAGMYDASLDVFMPLSWDLHLYESFGSRFPWQTTTCFGAQTAQNYDEHWNSVYPTPDRTYDQLNLFGYNLGGYGYGYGGGGRVALMGGVKTMSAVPMAMMDAQSESRNMKTEVAMKSSNKRAPAELEMSGAQIDNSAKQHHPADNKSLSSIPFRTNFNETAFFYPHLQTDKNGTITFSFTMPEALTRWKFMGLAHTKDLKIGRIEKEVVTQKDLMVMPNAPRFFREQDTIVFPAKIVNLSDKELHGNAQLMLFDALTMKPVDSLLNNMQPQQSFTAKKGESVSLFWKLTIPEHLQALTYRVVAKAGTFSDGEEMTLPVLTNRMLVTETMPLPIRGKQTKKFTLKKLLHSDSSQTLTHHKLTLEFTANPAWYAVQALPYLMEYPYDCSEQVFSKFYANALASHIANANPRTKQVFDTWKNLTPDALLSSLEKNQDLKNLMLQETPWVLQAKNETQRKQNIGLLFDLNRMANESQSALRKLSQLQSQNGGWPWFVGMPDNRYITQHIVTGLGHLQHLGIDLFSKETRSKEMVNKAIRYLDERIREDYEHLLKNNPETMDKNHLGETQIQYLYTRTYFYEKIGLSKKNKEAFEYYKTQAQKYWLSNSRYMQGMIALALNRTGMQKTAQEIIASLRENAVHSEELGMYFTDMSTGYYWYQAPIETMALLIEAFDEVVHDTKSVEELRLWLLKNKQTNDWKTTKATADACYALLLRGSDLLATESNMDITIGTIHLDPNTSANRPVEAGTGYFSTSWNTSDITPAMGTVTIKKNTDGAAWGALYWQYFEQLDKITPHETPLQLRKKLFIERQTARGPVLEPYHTKNTCRIGDKLIVRIELRVDRTMEYIHMKDMRASGFEPISVISTYKYQDGLGYYESTKDAATNFFIDYLPKGTYVFEYPLRARQAGHFSNGITTIQCMYAPEFGSHSEGVRVRVTK